MNSEESVRGKGEKESRQRVESKLDYKAKFQLHLYKITFSFVELFLF